MGLKLMAELGLDGTGFQTGLSKVAGEVKGMIAGAFTVGAIEELSRRTIEYASKLEDLSSRLGVSTDFLQEFRYIAKQTGSDLDDLTKIIEKLNQSRNKALGGDAKMLEAFRNLGVGDKQLRGRLEDSISGPIANAFQKGDAQGKIGAAWREVAGKSAGTLIAGFTEGFNEGRRKAHDAGAVWSEDIIQQLDEVGDQFAVLGEKLLVEWGTVMISLIGWVRKLGNAADQALNFVVGGTSQWSGKDWAANILDTLFPANGPEGMGLGSKLLGHEAEPFNYDTATKAAKESAEDFKKEIEAEAAARKNRREARAKRRSDVNPEPSGHTGGRQRAEDSLVKVGNFLGSSRNSLANIGEKTNAYLKSMDGKLAQLVSQGASGGTEFPGT